MQKMLFSSVHDRLRPSRLQTRETFAKCNERHSPNGVIKTDGFGSFILSFRKNPLKAKEKLF